MSTRGVWVFSMLNLLHPALSQIKTIMLDNDILDSFRQQAHAEGLGYQTLIKRALRAHTGEHLWDERVLRKIIREEVQNSLIDKG